MEEVKQATSYTEAQLQALCVTINAEIKKEAKIEATVKNIKIFVDSGKTTYLLGVNNQTEGEKISQWLFEKGIRSLSRRGERKNVLIDKETKELSIGLTLADLEKLSTASSNVKNKNNSPAPPPPPFNPHTFSRKLLSCSLNVSQFFAQPFYNYGKDYQIFMPSGLTADRVGQFKQLVDELNKEKENYAFVSSTLQGLINLRKISRRAHGFDELVPNGNIYSRTLDSPFDKILKGKDAEILDANQKKIMIDAKKIKEYQEAITFVKNDNITVEEIIDIQKIKSDSNNKEKYAPEIRNTLEVKGINFLSRAKAAQYLDEKGERLESPRERIFYYGCFPRLQRDTPDLKHFTEDANRKDGDPIKITKEEEYKDSVKTVVRLMLEAANANKEAIDIVTPNAFFFGLTKGEAQNRAKTLFIEAVLELLSEDNIEVKYPDVPFVSLHPEPKRETDLENQKNINVEEKINKQHEKIRIPILLNKGDASAPQRAAEKLELKFRVGEALMGNVLSPAGNGALGDGAAQAKEENDARKTFLQLMFNAVFNSSIYKKLEALPAPQQLIS